VCRGGFRTTLGSVEDREAAAPHLRTLAFLDDTRRRCAGIDGPSSSIRRTLMGGTSWVISITGQGRSITTARPNRPRQGPAAQRRMPSRF
jgi:hypothetical protein